ncbi:unnamed protein product [Brassica oleracea var. botrytis]
MIFPHALALLTRYRNSLPIDHLFFHYSNSSTLNHGVLNGCVTEKISALW